MRAHELLSEAIHNGTRRLGFFLDRQIKTIEDIIAKVSPAVDTIKAIEKGDSGADYFLRYALGHVNDGDRPFLPSAYSVDLRRDYVLEDLLMNLKSIKQYGTDRFLRYLISTLQYLKPLNDEYRHVLTLMPRADEGLRDYGFQTGDDDLDPDYRAARSLADAFLVIAQQLVRVETAISELKVVARDLEKRQEHRFNPPRYRPDHEPVETLYHASVYASEIVRDGFAAEKPVERRGVGNFGNQSLISFTHDLKIAHDIMRALKDIWMIVHGELTRRQIIGWMQAEGIDLQKASGFFMSSREPVDTPRQVVRLYRAYLALSKIRTDPVLVGTDDLVEIMRNRKLTDIGIVSCPVRLDGEEEYLHGEAEFRVPASRVVGPIKRII